MPDIQIQLLLKHQGRIQGGVLEIKPPFLGNFFQKIFPSIQKKNFQPPREISVYPVQH